MSALLARFHADVSELGASSGSTGVFPFLTLCLGPRTEVAGLVGMAWLITSQSKSIRKASCSLTVGTMTSSYSHNMVDISLNGAKVPGSTVRNQLNRRWCVNPAFPNQ